MAVISDLACDARVWKEVRSLERMALSVRLIGCSYELASVRRRKVGTLEVVEYPLGRRSGRVSRLRRAGTLLRVWLEILRSRASVHHSHNIHVGPAGWLASRFRGSRLVYDAHELYGEAEPGARWWAVPRISLVVERFLVRRSDAVFTTNASRADVLREGHGRASIRVLQNVPRCHSDVEPLDPGYPPGPVLLYQGGIYATSRAFRETLEAMRLLEDVQFVLLGFGRDHDLSLIRKWATELGVSKRVHFLPPRPFDELVRTAAAATIGLVPLKPHNTNHKLGDTNKLHEYLMAGLPVVASDLPELRRVLTAGDVPVGELFDPSAPESIAAAVRRVLDDPALYAERRVEARRLAQERFNWDAEEPTLLEVYRSLLWPGNGASPLSRSGRRRFPLRLPG